MLTVGRNLVPLSPLAAFVVVVSHSMVLVLFSSRTLEELLLRQGLPPIPLIPVSSSQAVIGAVIGIALSRGLAGLQLVQWRTLAGVAGGWIATPIAAGLGCFVLFFVQNVFNQRVQVPRNHVLDAPVLDYLARAGTLRGGVGSLQDREIEGELAFLRALREERPLPRKVELEVLQAARLVPTSIDSARFERLDTLYLSDVEIEAIMTLEGRSFQHRWQLEEALADASPAWRRASDTPLLRIRGKKIDEKLDYLCRFFRITGKEW
jgi:PiT family inorganic phosphate transporter